MITICENCDNLHPSSRKDRREWTALCMAHPRIERADLVFSGITGDDPPFMYCRHINGGSCPNFVPLKQLKEKD